MSLAFDRRQLLALGGAGITGSLVGKTTSPAYGADNKPGQFGYCLNMSTIRGADGKPLPITEQIDIAAQAGYDAIEPWTRELQEYKDSGGNMRDLRKRIDDAGVTVESAIGFATWIVDDEVKRAEGYETAKRDMELLLEIGGKRLAAPPVGATKQTDLNLLAAAERYRELLEIGDAIGVVPELELWGFSSSMSRLGELMFVAVESGHPSACVLPDVYHIYKGGSDFAGLGLINGAAIHVFHMNDYPADPPRDRIGDADRVYPGDGVAPLGDILRMLRDTGSHCMLSLELFNREYWKQDPKQVAAIGLAKMRAAVEAAFA
ncbi:MAG: sugar phosphate isomerase/epimerase [Planctomycetaceae bacterium]|nr:sugar phosphate isomerase/epimerase [Planctomycetales bacterium]MCB9923908.1 sugar phosphate isomerase/epimerase [Planctomycetaceae bacterium]